MKIILFTPAGDELLLETNVVEEAEKILREYQAKGCSALTADGSVVVLEPPLPKEIFILWPMAGGQIDGMQDLLNPNLKVQRIKERRSESNEILIQDTWDVTVIWLIVMALMGGLFFWLTN